MVSEQSVIRKLAFGLERRDVQVGTGIHQLTVALQDAALRFVRIPILPHAALWEASLWVGGTARADDGCVEPDPFASESHFVRDGFPFA